MSRESIQPGGFQASGSRFKESWCHGVQIVLLNRQMLDSPALGIEIASALYRLYPKDFQIDKTLRMIGSRKVLQAIKAGQDPAPLHWTGRGHWNSSGMLRLKYYSIKNRDTSLLSLRINGLCPCFNCVPISIRSPTPLQTRNHAFVILEWPR